MIAIIWLVMVLLAGWKTAGFIFPQYSLLKKQPAIEGEYASDTNFSVFNMLFRSSAAIWLGLVPLSWLTYGLAVFLAAILPASVHPLAIANPILLVGGYGILLTPVLKRFAARASCRFQPSSTPQADDYDQSVLISLSRSITRKSQRFFLITALVWLVFAAWLMTMTFHQDGAWIRAGYSVFSDFAPHTALIRSFAQGRNFPTQYPHFANDGIAYHFMFFFLSGNLHYLGLPVDWSINIPSILGLFSFCLLLGTLAVQLTGRKATYLLAPSLLFLRSSMAFWTHLRDLIIEYGWSLSGWRSILSVIWHQSVFIGQTPRDDWGLWGINVYANQRHFLPGLAAALLVILFFLPDLEKNLRSWTGWKNNFFSKKSWQLPEKTGRRQLWLMLIFCCLLPYFHGSATVALMLVLAFMAIFSQNRLAYVLTGFVTLLAAFIQSAVFAGHVARVVEPAFYFGFISPDRSWLGIIQYVLEMSGLSLPLWLAVWIISRRQTKPLLIAFIMPGIFAFTVSLTPDVTVNHKYIMISLALMNIFIADLLIRLWHFGRDAHIAQPSPSKPPTCQFLTEKIPLTRCLSRTAAVMLAIMLMITGVQEIVIVRNINQNTVSINQDSELVRWISQNTKPDAVFVTAPHHFHEFFLSGRFAWLGHSYYAWSAGHDTARRQEQMAWLLAGGDGDLVSLQAMIRGSHLDYLLIDDALRQHPDFDLNEVYFSNHFEIVAEFPLIENSIIYRLR